MNKRMLIALVLVLIGVGTGIWLLERNAPMRASTPGSGSSVVDGTGQGLSEADVLNLHAAVFDYLMARYGTAGGTAPSFHCLAVVGYRDPDSSFLARWEKHTPPVKPGSACGLAKDGGWIEEKATGKRAIIFAISKVVIKSATEAEVDGGYTVASDGGEGGTYVVKRQNGAWVVTGMTGSRWIS